ncbi:MAG: hypothetical protein HY645_13495 [Acidobacteria bacterium]|nr:hypothetical protein [Acidobacteriota bacterium]
MAQVVKELNIEGLNISKFYEFAVDRVLSDYKNNPREFEHNLRIYLDLRGKTE